MNLTCKTPTVYTLFVRVKLKINSIHKYLKQKYKSFYKNLLHFTNSKIISTKIHKFHVNLLSGPAVIVLSLSPSSSDLSSSWLKSKLKFKI